MGRPESAFLNTDTTFDDQYLACLRNFTILVVILRIGRPTVLYFIEQVLCTLKRMKSAATEEFTQDERKQVDETGEDRNPVVIVYPATFWGL